MENRSYALMTGFFTIALLIAAVLAGVWLNRDRVERVPYMIATTQSIPGLNPQAAVRYRGLEVGKVADISFDPKVTGQILIRILVDPDAPITRTTFATLGYQGVTGIAFVQLDDEQTGSPRLVSRTPELSRIPMRPGLLDQLEKRGIAILDQTEVIMKRVDTLLSPANQQRIMGTFDEITRTAEAYAVIPQRLEPALERMPVLVRKAEQSLDSFDTLSASANKAVQNYDALATSLQGPNGAVTRLNTTIDRVGGSLESVVSELELNTLPRFVDAADEARVSLRAVRRTATSLGERPQSLLFGGPNATPGPGEPGFVPPAAESNR